MDLSKLSTGDKVIGVAAIVLFISSFMDWFNIEARGIDVGGGNGWDVGFFWAGIPVLLGLAMLAVVAIKAFAPETQLPDPPIGWPRTLFVAGVVAAAIVVLKLIVGEDGNDFLGIEVNRAFGLFLATLASLGLAVGGYLKWRQEDEAGRSKGSVPPTPF